MTHPHGRQPSAGPAGTGFADAVTAAYPTRPDATMPLPQAGPPDEDPADRGIWRTRLIVLGVVTAVVAAVVATAVVGLSGGDQKPAAAVPAPATSPAVPPVDVTSAPATRAAEPPLITTQNVTTTSAVPFATRKVKDRSLPKGTRTVRVRGVPGVRQTTYQVTYRDHRPVSKKLVRSVVVTKPVTEVVAVGAGKRPKR